MSKEVKTLFIGNLHEHLSKEELTVSPSAFTRTLLTPQEVWAPEQGRIKPRRLNSLFDLSKNL